MHLPSYGSTTSYPHEDIFIPIRCITLAPASAAETMSRWYAVFDECNNTYYCNFETQETSWDLPTGAILSVTMNSKP